MTRRSDLQRLPWHELLQSLLPSATPTPAGVGAVGVMSRYGRMALEREFERRLQRLAESSGLSVLTPEEQRRVVGEVKHALWTQEKIDKLRTLRHQREHIQRMLRSRAKAVRQAAGRAAAKRAAARR